MKHKFKVGDKVTPVDSSRRTFGHTGVVTKVTWVDDVVVKFDHLRSPATFISSSLRLALDAPAKKSDVDGVWVLVYTSTDDLRVRDQDIFMGDINSVETKKAIALALNIHGTDSSFVFTNQDDVDEEINEQAGIWEYVYGFINGKPFRVISKPKIEIAE